MHTDHSGAILLGMAANNTKKRMSKSTTKAAPAKIDGRTREGRAAKAQAAASGAAPVKAAVRRGRPKAAEVPADVTVVETTHVVATKTAGRKRGPRVVTTEHRQAMQTGRSESRIAKSYLEALAESRPGRGRARNPERMRERLIAIGSELRDADPLARVHLIQEQKELRAHLTRLDGRASLESLEREFAAIAVSYSRRHGITREAWLEAGVPAKVLKQAGVV